MEIDDPGFDSGFVSVGLASKQSLSSPVSQIKEHVLRSNVIVEIFYLLLLIFGFGGTSFCYEVRLDLNLLGSPGWPYVCGAPSSVSQYKDQRHVCEEFLFSCLSFLCIAGDQSLKMQAFSLSYIQPLKLLETITQYKLVEVILTTFDIGYILSQSYL